jgi:hypothetical protein
MTFAHAGHVVAEYRGPVVDGARARLGWLLLGWAAAALLLSAGCLATSVVAQQAGRLGADDVPRALAHRSVDLLAAGADPRAVAAGPAVDLATDSSAFVAVYGPDHHVLASTATLGGVMPPVPAGVLDRAFTSGAGHVTWQPAAGVREAVVTQRWSGAAGEGVVVAGVGLGPSEHRTGQILAAVSVAWLVGMVVVTLAAAVAWRWPAGRRGSSPPP